MADGKAAAGMSILALCLALPLVGIAALHAYWGVGGVWPGTDGASCARTVAGFRGMEAMPPPTACFAVALVVVVMALVALALGGWYAEPIGPAHLAGMALFIGLVLLGRGALGFTPWWRRLAPEQPFARLDRRYYSPLLVLLGLGFLALAFAGLAA